MDTDVLATGNSEIASGRRAASQHNCIELLSELLAGDVDANVHIAAEFNAFGFELGQTTIKMLLFHLEFGNAVTEKATRPIGPFEDHYIVTSTRQLLCSGESCRPRADDSD